MLVTLLLTPLFKKLSFYLGVLDIPKGERKIHKKPMPLMGGSSIFFGFLLVLAIYLYFDDVNFFLVPLRFFVGIIVGAVILMIGGFFDDKYDLPAKIKFVYPALASIAVIVSGIGVGINRVTNPLGGTVSLDFLILGIPAAVFFVWFWMMGTSFTTKLLDGLDGLSAGIGLIGSVAIFFLSLTPKVNQPVTATLAIIFAGCLLGYLCYSFNPAQIFLGEGGSLLIGYMLGVLAIISGAKIATALLVMGVPILDVAWVILRRLWQGKSPFTADRKHLHFRLLDVGLSHKQAVISLYVLSAIFGFTAVFLQSMGKFIALVVLFSLTLILAISLVILYKKREKIKKI